MSNFEFLIEDKEQLALYPWFELVYREAKEVEQDYKLGHITRMLRDCRYALEIAVKNYGKEMKITIKKQTIIKRKKHKKTEDQGRKKAINLTSPEDMALRDGINAIQPKGHLLPAAHFIRKEGNAANHQIGYVGIGREYDCLKYLHDIVLWMYVQLTDIEVVSEFSLENIDERVEYSDRERLQGTVQQSAVKKVSQRKKKNKNKNKRKEGFHFETRKNEIVIVDHQDQEIFVFEDSQKEEAITQKQLPAVLNNMKYMLMEINNCKNVVAYRVRQYEQDNQYALADIQNYINGLGMGEENTQTLLEYFAGIQKEQHAGLEEIIRRIEENLRDKEACIRFLEQLSESQNIQIDLLGLKIINLEKNIAELLEELKNLQIQEESQLLSVWVQKIKDNFQNENENGEKERYYSKVEFEQLYHNFKKQFNRVSFLYESEKLMRQKQDYELVEYEFKLEEQKNVNKKLVDNINDQKNKFWKNKKKQKSLMRLMRYFSASLLVCISILIILFLWQRERAESYQKQYDEIMDLLEYGTINRNPMYESEKRQEEETNEGVEEPLVEDKEDFGEEESFFENMLEEEYFWMDDAKEESSQFGKIVEGVYFSQNGEYRIDVPEGWDLYSMNNGVYLGNSEEILESDMFYSVTDFSVNFENVSMNWYVDYWGEENIYFSDFDYCTYGGRPCVKSYIYVTFEINGVRGGNYILTYTILADKEYEFHFVDRDNAGDLYVTAEEMMESLVFLTEDMVEEPTEMILKKMAADMLEAYFIRRNYEDTCIHLTRDYKKELGNDLLSMLNSLPDKDNAFYYEIRDLQVDGNTAEAKVYMQWSHLGENISTMKFIKEGNAWKIDYFNK